MSHALRAFITFYTCLGLGWGRRGSLESAAQKSETHEEEWDRGHGGGLPRLGYRRFLETLEFEGGDLFGGRAANDKPLQGPRSNAPKSCGHERK